MTVRNVPSANFPHVRWIELHGDNILHECAVMREDEQGNILFIEINNLDDVDKRRLVECLVTRNSDKMKLWEIMEQKTLGNGINALKYFHQLVKVITPGGKIIDPRQGVMGVQTGQVKTDAAAAPTSLK